MPSHFRNRILSLQPAVEGSWQVSVIHFAKDLETSKTASDTPLVMPVYFWAVVERIWPDEDTTTCIEPVFFDGGEMVAETEYRRLHSDLEPTPGEPKITIRVDLRRKP